MYVHVGLHAQLRCYVRCQYQYARGSTRPTQVFRVPIPVRTWVYTPNSCEILDQRSAWRVSSVTVSSQLSVAILYTWCGTLILTVRVRAYRVCMEVRRSQLVRAAMQCVQACAVLLACDRGALRWYIDPHRMGTGLPCLHGGMAQPASPRSHVVRAGMRSAAGMRSRSAALVCVAMRPQLPPRHCCTTDCLLHEYVQHGIKGRWRRDSSSRAKRGRSADRPCHGGGAEQLPTGDCGSARFPQCIRDLIQNRSRIDPELIQN
jgi:hypothetical protein